MTQVTTESEAIVAGYRHPFIFMSAALVGSTLLWLAAAWVAGQPRPHPIALTFLLFAGLIFPLLAGMALASRDRLVWRDLLSRLWRFNRLDLSYSAIGAAMMLGSILAAQLISLLFGYSPSQFQFAGSASFSAGLASGVLVLVVAPVAEELGWHSYGTDALRARMSLFWTSLVFGVYWVVWHLPLALVPGLYQAEVAETGWLYSLNFAVSVIPFVLIMNWLYYRADRSVLVAVVVHTGAGVFNEMFQTHPMSKVIQTGLLLCLTVGLMVWQPRMFFRRRLTDLGTPPSGAAPRP